MSIENKILPPVNSNDGREKNTPDVNTLDNSKNKTDPKQAEISSDERNSIKMLLEEGDNGKLFTVLSQLSPSSIGIMLPLLLPKLGLLSSEVQNLVRSKMGEIPSDELRQQLSFILQDSDPSVIQSISSGLLDSFSPMLNDAKEQVNNTPHADIESKAFVIGEVQIVERNTEKLRTEINAIPEQVKLGMV